MIDIAGIVVFVGGAIVGTDMLDIPRRVSGLQVRYVYDIKGYSNMHKVGFLSSNAAGVLICYYLTDHILHQIIGLPE